MLKRSLNILAIVTALSASACGTFVPGLQELSTDASAEQKLVQAIVTSIHCDLSNAVIDFIDSDRDAAVYNKGLRQAAWIDRWGAQVTITLTIEDQTTLNPTATGLPPSPADAVFTIAGGLRGSATATRTNKLNFFYTVKDLYKRGGCQTGIQPTTGAPSPLIQNNLRTKDWLFDQIAPSGTKEGVYPVSSSNVFQQNVLSHDVKFQIITSGSLNPTWKLTRVFVNDSGTLVSTSRDRTSDLLVTFGPLDPSQNNKSLIPQAENIHFAQQFGLATSTYRDVSRASLFPLF